MFVKKVFLEILQNWLENTCARVSCSTAWNTSGGFFWIKVEICKTYNHAKKRLWHRCFPVNFMKFPRTSFFIEHLWWLFLSYTKCMKPFFANITLNPIFISLFQRPYFVNLWAQWKIDFEKWKNDKCLIPSSDMVPPLELSSALPLFAIKADKSPLCMAFFKRSFSSRNSRISLSMGFSLTTALFLIFFARSAYLYRRVKKTL